MKKIIFTIISFALLVSCSTGTVKKSDNTLTIHVYDIVDFCSFRQNVRTQLNSLPGVKSHSVETVSKTKLTLTYNSDKLKAYSTDFSEVSSLLKTFIEDRYPGVETEIDYSSQEIIITYGSCNRLNYTKIKNFAFKPKNFDRMVQNIDIAKFTATYTSSKPDILTGKPYAVIKVNYNKNISRTKLISLIETIIKEYKNSKGFAPDYRVLK